MAGGNGKQRSVQAPEPVDVPEEQESRAGGNGKDRNSEK